MTLKQFKNNESGATAVEYGLIAALIAVIIAAVSALGTEISTTFTNFNAEMDRK